MSETGEAKAHGRKTAEGLLACIDSITWDPISGELRASLLRWQVLDICLCGTGIPIMSWFRLIQDEKQKDFELALSLAKNHPELFEVAHEYEFADFQKAIQHASRPGKTGIVLLKSPA